MRTTALPPVFQPASFHLASRAPPSAPLAGHFPSRGSSGPGMSRACLPSCRLAVLAPEGAGRLSCLYSANKEANCSHQGGPLGWGELPRTLFLRIAFWGCLSAHQAVLRIPLPRRGPTGYQGDGRVGLGWECLRPTPLLVGRRQDGFFSLETKPVLGTQ